MGAEAVGLEHESGLSIYEYTALSENGANPTILSYRSSLSPTETRIWSRVRRRGEDGSILSQSNLSRLIGTWQCSE